ncbi:MAG: hypothetical protein KDA44_13280 [Planctomycetales bacterium]|nr:hypothetical protein [Planctomycetales bacterium]
MPTEGESHSDGVVARSTERAPLATVIAADTISSTASLLDSVVLCWAPPGQRLRWHAYFSVWRN